MIQIIIFCFLFVGVAAFSFGKKDGEGWWEHIVNIVGFAVILGPQGRLCAIVEWEEGLLKPRKVFGLEGME